MKNNLAILFMMITIVIYAQGYPENVHVICICEINKQPQSNIYRNGQMIPYIIAPTCNIHQPASIIPIDSVIILKKRRKNVPKLSYPKPSSIIRF